jgi:hypothetical protein
MKAAIGLLSGQDQKEVIMKLKVFRAMSMLGIVITLAVGASVHAQTLSGNMMTINVPFDFSVGERRLPAGEYTVRRISKNCLCFSIQNRESYESTTILARTSVRADKKRIRPGLTFNRYQKLYFLSRIWMADTSLGSELWKSRAERVVAENAEKPESVVLLF